MPLVRPNIVARCGHTCLGCRPVPYQRRAPRRQIHPPCQPPRPRSPLPVEGPGPYRPQEALAGAAVLHRALQREPWLLDEALLLAERGEKPYDAFDRFGVTAVLAPRDFLELRGVLALRASGSLPEKVDLDGRLYSGAQDLPAHPAPVRLLAAAALDPENARLAPVHPRAWSDAAAFASAHQHRPEVRLLIDAINGH